MGSQTFINFKVIGGFIMNKDVESYEKEYVDMNLARGLDLTFYGNWQKDFGKLIIEISDLEANIGKAWVSILDIGCATGLNLRAIDELNIFKEIYGTDISNYMINSMIPEMYADHKWNAEKVDFFCTPSHDLSMIADNSIDLITCTHVFEHIKSEELLEKTLNELKRILHKEGKIIIILPTSKTEDQDLSGRTDISPFHILIHSVSWWSKTFAKYFKSESFKARQLFKKSELKPDRSKDKTFYENYPAWNIFRLIHK